MKRNILTFLLPFLLFLTFNGFAKKLYSNIPLVIRGRAISIKELQKTLHDSRGNLSKELLQFYGVTKIMGYIVDKKNNDLILLGQVDTKLPPLYLEDFVVALRNTWLKYAQSKQSTLTYSYPSCSIDPNPQTVQKLQIISRRMLQSLTSKQAESEIKNWHMTCAEPQSVRVMGIPFNSHFAKVMVTADYNMKSLVDGSDSLVTIGFSSLIDMKLREIRDSLLQNKPITVSMNSMQRFWFSSGNNIYEENRDIILIKQCPVILLTEGVYLSRSKKYSTANDIDIVAKKFAEDFSSLYNEISDERPIYRELKNLFLVVALAKVIKFKSSHLQAGLDLSYLLDNFPISNTPVTPRLPGRSTIKEFQMRRDFDRGYQIAQIWLPSCGGVSIDIDMSSKNFIADRTDSLIRQKEIILSSRPSNDQTYWDFQFVLKSDSNN